MRATTAASVTFTGTPWRWQESTTHATTAGSTFPSSGTERGAVAAVRSVGWVTIGTVAIGTP